MVTEDQDHLSFCDGYADLKLEKDLEEESDFVDFYRLVMAGGLGLEAGGLWSWSRSWQQVLLCVVWPTFWRRATGFT